MLVRWWSLAFAIAATLLITFFIVTAAGVGILTDPTVAMRGARPLAAVVGVLLLIADVLQPIPTSLVMVAHGALFGVAGGTALSLIGSVAATLTAFAIGRAGNDVVRRFVTPREYDRASALLERWGVVAIAATRPIPILAETTALLAGSSRLTWKETTIAATAGSIVPAVVYAWAGAHTLGTASVALLFGGVIAVTLAMAAVSRFKKRAARPALESRESGGGVPPVGMAEPPPYQVARPQASGPSTIQPEVAASARGEHDPLRPRAVFVAHGMGQQVPFQTLDDVARGLCKTIATHDVTVQSRVAATVRVGCETLQRLELELRSKEGQLAPIHLYEAYWAPLTEGVAGLWQVVRFLLSGGWNGLRSDARLNRFMFQRPRQFHLSRWAITALFVVIATVIAMVVIGGTISAVAIARFTLQDTGWVNPRLVGDLTLLFERLLGVIAGSVAIAVALVFISRLLLPAKPSPRRDRAARIVSALTILPGFAVILALTFSAYIAIPLIFMFDEEPPFAGRAGCVWCAASWGLFDGWGAKVAAAAYAARGFVDRLLLCPLPEHSAWFVLVGIGMLIVFYAAQALLSGKAAKQAGQIAQAENRGRGGRTAGLGLALFALAGILAICGHGDALAFSTWLLLFAAVLFVRSFLITYIGDVAIYVSPHVVDRFYDVRTRIKSSVRTAARAVYACRDKDGSLLYENVVVVGHSLGSVIVYDVLNRLINDDDLAGGTPEECCDGAPVENLRVETRTKLLLTFGSPLDKTAFIFARHDPHGGSERDALAASVQPLITRERKLRWINLFTPFDILGGSLEFYDTPERDGEEQPNTNRVVNAVDPRAITPILAHTEFWDNTLMYEAIYDPEGTYARLYRARVT
jgi:uncharacterized membrane protein YdjX (TVP38/TMEM64 family)